MRVAGVLERAQMPWIRSGHRTMFLTLEDETELGQVVVFNDVYLKYGRVLKDAVYLLVDGELQNDEEHGLAVVAHRITDLAAAPSAATRVPAAEAAASARRPRLPAAGRLGAPGRGAAHAAGPDGLTTAAPPDQKTATWITTSSPCAPGCRRPGSWATTSPGIAPKPAT